MNSIDRALQLLEQRPVAKDLREQIDALYKVTSDEEKPMFDMIYEGLFLLENTKKTDSDSWENLKCFGLWYAVFYAIH